MSTSRVERLNAFSKLVAAPKNLGHIDLAIQRKRQKEKRENTIRKFNDFKRLITRATTFGSKSDMEENDDDGVELQARKSTKKMDLTKKKSRNRLDKSKSSGLDKGASFGSAVTFGSTASDGNDDDDDDDDNNISTMSGSSEDTQKKKRKSKKKKEKETADDDDDAAESKKFRIWDVINEGQPNAGNFLGNLLNYVLTTPLHLKRSHSKLEASKKMSSRDEIEYLSSTHGLTVNKDSSLCYEMMTWRRSSLWILVLFGTVNCYFGTMALIEDMQHTEYNRELAENAPLHRFPSPKYVSEEVRDFWGLADPMTWTLYTGTVEFNHTAINYGDTDTSLLYGTYHLVDLAPNGVVTRPAEGYPVGLVSREFSHGDDRSRFSINVNGTVRNALNFCMEMGEDTVGANVTLRNCVADFVGYEAKSESLLRQTWDNSDADRNARDRVHLKSPNGFCLGLKNKYTCTDHEDYEGLGPYSCQVRKDNGECTLQIQRDMMRTVCPATCAFCDPSSDQVEQYGALDDDGTHENIALTLVDCDSEEKWDSLGEKLRTLDDGIVAADLYTDVMSVGYPLSFILPDATSYKERLDWYCDSLLKPICSEVEDSHVNMDMTLLARYDIAHPTDNYMLNEGVVGLLGETNHKFWRCYSTNALLYEEVGENGEKKKGSGVFERTTYDIGKESRNYCTKHDELKNELKLSLGAEPFKDFSLRMGSVGFILMKYTAMDIDEIIKITLLVMNFCSVILAIGEFRTRTPMTYTLTHTDDIHRWLRT